MNNIQTRQIGINKWRRHIEKGNRLFSAKHFAKAICEYQQSKQEAISLFEDWPDPDQSTAAVIVSHHNLAVAYTKKNQKQRAYDELMSVNEFLCLQLDKCGAVYPERLIAILKGIDKTKVALICYAKENGIELKDEFNASSQMIN